LRAQAITVDRNELDLRQFLPRGSAEGLVMPNKDLQHFLALASTLALAAGAIAILFTM